LTWRASLSQSTSVSLSSQAKQPVNEQSQSMITMNQTITTICNKTTSIEPVWWKRTVHHEFNSFIHSFL